MDNAGLSSYGPNYFDKNTGFFWKITPEGNTIYEIILY